MKIVNIDWLNDSFEAKRKVYEEPYLMANASTQKAKVKKSADHSKSRSQPSKDLDEVKAPGKKRERSSKIKDEPSDEEEERPQKKIRDGQKASSAKLNVPVDEGCNLSGQTSFLSN